MKKIKIALDIIMLAVMLLLMNMQVTGLNIHEILGIMIFALFIIHKVLNRKWITAISKNIFKKSINLKTKVMYWLDVVLLIVLTINVVTGILISKYVLTSIQITNIELTTNIHNLISIISMILIALHLGFHLENIIIKIKKSLNKPMESGVINIIVKCIYTIVAVAAICVLTKRILFKKNNNISTNTVSNNTVVTKKEDDDDQTNASAGNSTLVDMPESIEEYLGKLFCTGCGRHCPLTSPQCGKGMSTQTAKIQEYNETYNTNVTYNSSSSATNKRR